MRNSVMFWGVILVILVSIVGGGGAAVVSSSDTQQEEELEAAQFTSNNTDFFDMSEGEIDFDYWNSTAEQNLRMGECGMDNPCPASRCCSKWGFCGDLAPWCSCKGCVNYQCESKTVPIRQCGKINTKRIIGGSVVSLERRYPWHVGIRIRNLKYYSCGGSIINNHWILTAAHCVVDAKSDITVVVGDHDQYSTNVVGPYTNTYSIIEIKQHTNYKKDDGISPVFDIALLKLSMAIPFNNIITPICLPANDYNTYSGRKSTVTGWGYITNKGPVSKYLKELQQLIHDKNTCGSIGSRPDIVLCAGGVAGEGHCAGDSGGALTVVKNGKHIQVGVVSFSGGDPVTNTYECDFKGVPGGYARVSTVIPWIKEVAGCYYYA